MKDSNTFLLIMQFSFSATVRTSPCFLSPSSLKSYDDELISILSSICNIHFEGGDDPSRIQASLPVNCGVLGFRSAVQLASPFWLLLLHPPPLPIIFFLCISRVLHSPVFMMQLLCGHRVMISFLQRVWLPSIKSHGILSKCLFLRKPCLLVPQMHHHESVCWLPLLRSQEPG